MREKRIHNVGIKHRAWLKQSSACLIAKLCVTHSEAARAGFGHGCGAHRVDSAPSAAAPTLRWVLCGTHGPIARRLRRTTFFTATARLALARLHILLMPKSHALAARVRTPPPTSSTGASSRRMCASPYLNGHQFPKVISGTEGVTTKFYYIMFVFLHLLDSGSRYEHHGKARRVLQEGGGVRVGHEGERRGEHPAYAGGHPEADPRASQPPRRLRPLLRQRGS